MPATILIVDDEAPNRRLLEALLHPEGYLTVCAESGEEALARVARDPPDLILLDIMMPGMDGHHVASVLKANPATKSIPIIMITALTDRSARLTGLNAGAEEFLTKPVDRAELWVRVRNLLRLKTLSDFLHDHGRILEQQVRDRTADLQRFRTAMDATADAIFLTDRATMRFVEVNATACALLGYTREELFSLGPAQVLEDSAAYMDKVCEEMSTGSLDTQSVDEPHQHLIAEMQMRRKDGSMIHVELGRHIQHVGDAAIVVSVVRDITERKEAQLRLHRMAHYDPLTGLPNRTLFYETLRKTLLLATEHNWLVAVLCIDLDNFKNINDTLGHPVGDELLNQCGTRLAECVRIRDTVGRLGGDEFAVTIVMQEDQQDAWLVAKKIRDVMRKPFRLFDHDVSITASIGITIHPDDAHDCETLLQYADTAMYQAKHAGRDTFRFFTAQMNANVVARLDMEIALRKAIDNQEFVLHYQPKVQIESGRIVGLEALLRWQRPGHGLVPPKDFIPLLEETGLIVSVGAWVIGEACRQIAAWMRGPIGPVQIAVNVSGRQFIEGDLDGDVVSALRDNDIPADLLELELTESSLMSNAERTIISLQNLKSLGVHISIDDFGTGYSSLAYLRRFPIDKLKIDIAFIRDITTNPDDAAIALAIISMAHSLKLGVVAEGVETAGQLAYLRRHHCDQIQGYYFSPPLRLPDVERALLDGKHLPEPEGVSGTWSRSILLVDEDAKALATLQRMLHHDGFEVLVAHSANKAFELLAQNSVQVILCGQHLRNISGIDFLGRARDLHPEALRIVLSDYSDIAEVMEAINCGKVHRIYTRAWDHAALRSNIREAFHHSHLSEEPDRLQA